MLAALGFKGGGGVDGATQILLRAAVASYLNACFVATPANGYSPASFPRTPIQVVDQTKAAISTGNRSTILALASTYDLFNNTATHWIVW